MSWMDILSKAGELTRAVGTIDEKLRRTEEDIRKLKDENSELRKLVSALSERVGILEEGRKTVAAEVKVALTETLAQLEIQRLKQELAESRDQPRLSARQAGSDDNH